MKKRFLSVLLCLVFMLTLAVQVAPTANAEIYEYDTMKSPITLEAGKTYKQMTVLRYERVGYTYKATIEGSVPGMSFSTTIMDAIYISAFYYMQGTPTHPGTYPVTLWLHDDKGNVVMEQPYEIIVEGDLPVDSVELELLGYAAGGNIAAAKVQIRTEGVDFAVQGAANGFVFQATDSRTADPISGGTFQENTDYYVMVILDIKSGYQRNYDTDSITLTVNGQAAAKAKGGMNQIAGNDGDSKVLVRYKLPRLQKAEHKTLSPMSVYYHDSEGREVQLLTSADSKREITVYLDELSKSVSGGLVHFVAYTYPLTEQEGLVTFSASNTDLYSRFSYQHNTYDHSDEVMVLFSKAGTTTITAKLDNGQAVSVTVHIKASKGYTVSFNAGGGSGTIPSVSGVSGSYTLPANGFTEPAGKLFKAWKVNGAEKLPGQTINVTADATVTAVWVDAPKESFVVHFDAGGGSGKMDSVTVSTNTLILPECTFVEPEMKMFDGWMHEGEIFWPGDEVKLQGSGTTITATWADLPMDHHCNGILVARVEPTDTEAGKEAYYFCDGCGNAYEDAEVSKLIPNLESWGILPPTGTQQESTEPADNTTDTTQQSSAKPQKKPTTDTEKETDSSVSWWIIALICVIGGGVGVTVALLLFKNIGKKKV